MNSRPPFQEAIALKDFCTLGIGGPARYFLEVKSIEQMQQAVAFCSANRIPYMLLGKGSNCLFDDRGFNGAVLLNKIDFMDEVAPGSFHVGGGYSFSLLGAQTARQGWTGLEFAAGIPGSVGGAVFMNAGANGMETCDVLESVDYVSADGALSTISRSDLSFAYRSSPFQKMTGAIVGATFRLAAGAEARKRQIELVNARTKSQPYTSMSAGCMFVNPPGQYAGALIERSGLKGFSVGPAQVSTMHANFLVNTGTATCAEMLALISHVKEKVKEVHGVELTSEVRRIPYEPETHHE